MKLFFSEASLGAIVAISVLTILEYLLKDLSLFWYTPLLWLIIFVLGDSLVAYLKLDNR